MAQTTLTVGNRFFPKFSDGQLWTGTYNRAGAWVSRNVTSDEAVPSSASDGFEFWGACLRVRLHTAAGGFTSGDVIVWVYAGATPTWSKLEYYDSSLTQRVYSITGIGALDIIIPEHQIVGSERCAIQLTNMNAGSSDVDYMIL